jgi:hypothetical protein
MATSKVIGGPFDEKVLKQLEVRSKLMAKPNRDDNTLRYLASRTGWVKMSSSVQFKGDDTLAKKYVLIGGTYGRVGNETYSNFYEGKGFRPMPGITGVDIKAINRFGLLKESTITYNCWDVSQLQELEMLFMRPGFSVLLEWGHSVYYTTDNNFVTVPQTVTSFFTKGTTKDMLYDEIETLKEQSGYNYDAIYGFIKNFSWSFRADGGYDCVTTLTSIGEIIESLQIDIDNPLPQGTSAEETNTKSKELIQSEIEKEKDLKENPDKKYPDPTKKEYIVIGDSQTPSIAKLSKVFKMVGDTDGENNLHKGGQALKWLTTAVGKYPVSEKVLGVAVCIGTNGGFSAGDDIKTFKAAMQRVFPKAQYFIVIRGSWGWGNNTAKYGITKAKADIYYKRWKDEGFTVTTEAIGDMTPFLKKIPAAPHTFEPAVYQALCTELDSIIVK